MAHLTDLLTAGIVNADLRADVALVVALDHDDAVLAADDGAAIRGLVRENALTLVEGEPSAAPEPEPLGRTIVLIEDDPDVLEAIRLVLETAGHAVVAAPGLAGALDALRALDQAPDAILADYRLESGATGSEAIRRLRQEFGPGIPGILLTGDTSPDRLREAENNGFRLLHKPVGPQELQQVVESML